MSTIEILGRPVHEWETIETVSDPMTPATRQDTP